jgi:hypothetical protein
MSSFAQLKATLREWPMTSVSNEAFEESPNERLRCALLRLQQSASGFGVADLASLIRHVLRCEMAQHGGYPKLTVPAAPSWPSSDDWRRHGCRAKVERPGFLEVEAKAWTPIWLGASPFAAVERGEQRRPLLHVPADPALCEASSANTIYPPVRRRQFVQ